MSGRCVWDQVLLPFIKYFIGYIKGSEQNISGALECTPILSVYQRQALKNVEIGI